MLRFHIFRTNVEVPEQLPGSRTNFLSNKMYAKKISNHKQLHWISNYLKRPSSTVSDTFLYRESIISSLGDCVQTAAR